MERLRCWENDCITAVLIEPRTKILFPSNFKGVEGLNTLGKVMNRFWAMADVINHVGVSDTVSSLGMFAGVVQGRIEGPNL